MGLSEKEENLEGQSNVSISRSNNSCVEYLGCFFTGIGVGIILSYIISTI